MMLSLVVSLTMAVCTVSLFLGGLGLCVLPSWVRVRMYVLPEDLKQPPIGAESMASDLPYPLGQLWDYLAQVDMTWLLCRAWEMVWLLCMAWIELGRWRNVKRPQGQVNNQDQSHRKGPGCGEQGTTTALVKKACNEKTKPSAGKKTSAGPESSSASSPGTCHATGLKPSGSLQHDTGPAEGFLSPMCCLGAVLRHWSSSRGIQAQQDTSLPLKPLPASLCPWPCHFQGRGQTASSSMGSDCWGKGTFMDYNMVCWLEANTALLVRHLRHVCCLHLKECQHQHSKKKEQEKGKKRRAFSSSPCNSS